MPSPRSAITAIFGGPRCTTDYASDLRNKAAHRVGLYFEKQNDTALALQLYRAGSSADCNERLARLLYASGDKIRAEELLRRMIDDPASDDEFMFASDFNPASMAVADRVLHGTFARRHEHHRR
jgi:DNA polymerase III subunit epsilon